MPAKVSATTSRPATCLVRSWNCLLAAGFPSIKARAHVASLVNLSSSCWASCASAGVVDGGGCSCACISASLAVASCGVSVAIVGSRSTGSNAMSASVSRQHLFSRRDALVYDADLAGDGIGPGVFGDRRAGNAFPPVQLLLFLEQRGDALLGGGNAVDGCRNAGDCPPGGEHRRA